MKVWKKAAEELHKDYMRRLENVMKITIERPLTEEELTLVEGLLEHETNRADREDKKDDKKACKKEDDFELWFF